VFYYKTESIIGSIVLHAYCNTLQVPKFGYLSNRELDKNTKITISIIYVVGIVSFFAIMFII